jgi:hypothetical protein
MRGTPTALLALLVLLTPAAMRAQTAGPFAAPDMDAARELVGSMKTLSRDMTARPSPAAAGRTVPFDLLRCGPWGVFCSQHLAMASRPQDHQNDTSPIGPGFKALGPAGKTGSIDGPGGKGNGVYRVVRNDDYHLQVVLKTGYLDGEVTLSRDPDSGAAAMRFAGRRWDNDEGKWGRNEDAVKEVVLEYSAKKDLGAIRWVEDGGWKSERYWNGAKGTGMTIEFGGGWDHDFQQAR